MEIRLVRLLTTEYALEGIDGKLDTLFKWLAAFFPLVWAISNVISGVAGTVLFSLVLW